MPVALEHLCDVCLWLFDGAFGARVPLVYGQSDLLGVFRARACVREVAVVWSGAWVFVPVCDLEALGDGSGFWVCVCRVGVWCGVGCWGGCPVVLGGPRR